MLLEAEIAGREEFIPDLTNNKFFMPTGLVGLPDFKKFELIVDPESLPFVILRCIEGDEIQIPAIEPCLNIFKFNPVPTIYQKEAKSRYHR